MIFLFTNKFYGLMEIDLSLIRDKPFTRGYTPYKLRAGGSNNSKGYFDKNMPSAFKRKKHKARAKWKKTQRASRKINHLKIKISKR